MRYREMTTPSLAEVLRRVPETVPSNFGDAIACCARHAMWMPMPRSPMATQSTKEYADLRYSRHCAGIDRCLDKFKSVIIRHLGNGTKDVCLAQMDSVATTMRNDTTMSMAPVHRLLLKFDEKVSAEDRTRGVTQCLDLALQLFGALEQLTKNAASIHDAEGRLLEAKALDSTGWTHYAIRLTQVTAMALINTACLLVVSSETGPETLPREVESFKILKKTIGEYKQAIAIDGQVSFDENSRCYREVLAEEVLNKALSAA